MRLFLAWLMILAITVPVAAEEEEEARPVGGFCPFGHSKLWEVPIHYGLILLGEKGEEAHANLEFVLGGCMYIEELSPTMRTVCRKCKYQFVEPVGFGSGYWQLTSRDPSAFEQPLGASLLGFVELATVTSGDKGELFFTQVLDEHGVSEETVRFTTAGELAAVVEAVLDFAEQDLAELRTLESDEDGDALRLEFLEGEFRGVLGVEENRYGKSFDHTLWLERKRIEEPGTLD